MNESENKPNNDPELILPSAEEIGVRFGERARSQWEKAGDGQRRGMLKRWERESVDAAKTTDPSAINDAAKKAAAHEVFMEMLALGESYIPTGDGEVLLRIRKIRYEAELHTSVDPLRIAQRALHCHVLNAFLQKDAVDFNEIIAAVRNDSRCAPLDERAIKTAYLHFIKNLIDAKEITQDMFDDDEIL